MTEVGILTEVVILIEVGILTKVVILTLLASPVESIDTIILPGMASKASFGILDMM